MVQINPFAALRPRADLVSQVASVPYDVINTAEATALAEGNAHSFLHVVRPDIDLPAGTDHYADEVYAKAKQNFEAMIADGVLIRERQPAIYLYLLSTELLGQRVEQSGVVCCCHIDDYAADRIKKHENTRPAKEDDRTRHVLTLKANAGPVFLLFKDDPNIRALTEDVWRDVQPTYDFEADDGVRHTIWKAPDPAPWVEAFGRHEAVYVADGHHRTASAARAGAELRAANPKHTGQEEYNWFQTVLFPASELTILPYHRVVADLQGMDSTAFLESAAKLGELIKTDTPIPESTGAFGIYVDGGWYRLTLAPESIDHADPIGSLDYVLLSERLLGPILGIEDIRTNNRVDFVGGIRGPTELERRVDSGDMAVAFALHATTIEQLIRVADAGRIMPPKSTWFEPKLRSGLLVHTI